MCLIEIRWIAAPSALRVTDSREIFATDLPAACFSNRQFLVIVVGGALPKPTGMAVVKDYGFFGAVAQALH